MPSKATQRIERIMTKLRMEGKLDVPYHPSKQRNTVQSKVADNRQRKAVQRPTESADCCVRRLSRLPDGVVPCSDCPLT